MTENDVKTKVSRTESIMSLRRRIFFLESENVHKKFPQTDSEMVDRLIKEIKKTVEMEDEKNAD